MCARTTFSNDDLPAWVPIPPLAEVQVALEDAVAEVTGL
jgi:AMP nucleosidase